MSSKEQKSTQTKETLRRLIEPWEFSDRVFQILNKEHPDIKEWNGSSGMAIIHEVIERVADEFQERLYKMLEQHVRNMDLHARSLLAEHHNFCDDINLMTLTFGMRKPLVGEDYRNRLKEIENDSQTQ